MVDEPSPTAQRGEVIRDGKSKRVYAVADDPRHVILLYKDDATAFNGVKHDVIKDKARVNAAISWHLLEHVSSETGIPSHLVTQLSDTEHLCERVEIIPVEVVVRNVVAGSCAKRYGRTEGEPLPFPMVEWFYKSDELNDPPLSDVHALAFGWAEQWELEYFRFAALKINAALRGFWDPLGVDLVDFKVEFGRTVDGRLLLADEISPDGCRLWEKGTGRKLDKDVFRRELGDLSEVYVELYQRIFGHELGA